METTTPLRVLLAFRDESYDGLGGGDDPRLLGGEAADAPTVVTRVTSFDADFGAVLGTVRSLEASFADDLLLGPATQLPRRVRGVGDRRVGRRLRERRHLAIGGDGGDDDDKANVAFASTTSAPCGPSSRTLRASGEPAPARARARRRHPTPDDERGGRRPGHLRCRSRSPGP
mmetsp:Transcript_15278/g.49947  ORF Transcript_15278/g.49947 Transcript_15278/m.49947 type:complete len:173 (+) Transcript_15278:480-998(+)